MPRTAGSKLIAEVNVEDYVDFESAQKAHELASTEAPDLVKVILESLQKHLNASLSVEYFLKNSSTLRGII